jgi:hypothetical protein
MKCFNPASNMAVIRYVSPQFMKFLPLQYFHVTYSIFETKYYFVLVYCEFFSRSEFLHITFTSYMYTLQFFLIV